jgi:hypothetical protein
VDVLELRGHPARPLDKRALGRRRTSPVPPCGVPARPARGREKPTMAQIADWLLVSSMRGGGL